MSAGGGARRPPGQITIESLTRAGIHDNYEPGESFSNTRGQKGPGWEPGPASSFRAPPQQAISQRNSPNPTRS